MAADGGLARTALGNLEFGPGDREVKVGGAPLALSAQEFALLRLLAARPGATVTYEALTLAIWGADGVEERRRLAVVVCRLRAKLVESRPFRVETQKKRGYRIVGAPEREPAAAS